MSKRQMLQVTIFIAGLVVSSLADGQTADSCLTKPSGPPPRGQHWYYHHTKNRVCWYLREVGVPVSQQAPQNQAAKASAQPAMAAQQKLAPQTQVPRPTTHSASSVPPENNASANAAQSPWPDPAASSPKPEFVWPGPLTPRLATQSVNSSSAGPISSAGANDADDPPRSADVHQVTSATDSQPPGYKRAPASTQKAAARIAASSKPHESYYFFLLFTLLVAGLAIGGLLHALVRLLRRRSAEALPPPVWTRVVNLNTAMPRVRMQTHELAASAPVQKEPFAAPPLVPAYHTEELTRTLHELAHRLRTQLNSTPSIVPDVARQPRLRDDSESTPLSGRSPTGIFGAGRTSRSSRRIPPTR